jgi:hypothetical protein
MPATAPLTGQFYQWSPTSPPAMRQAGPEPAPGAAPEPLTERLNLRLGELRAAGYEIRWITASLEALTTLLSEGGDQAIMMDPDPARDVAWYGRHEIRPSPDPLVRIYVEGGADELSCHIV